MLRQFNNAIKDDTRLKFHNFIALCVMPCLTLTYLPQMQKFTVDLWDFRLVILPFLNINWLRKNLSLNHVGIKLGPYVHAEITLILMLTFKQQQLRNVLMMDS